MNPTGRPKSMKAMRDKCHSRKGLRTAVVGLLTTVKNLKQKVRTTTAMKDHVEAELTKHKAILEDMKDRVECPVCLVVPREGPVPMCPRGHFLCTGHSSTVPLDFR